MILEIVKGDDTALEIVGRLDAGEPPLLKVRAKFDGCVFIDKFDPVTGQEPQLESSQHICGGLDREIEMLKAIRLLAIEHFKDRTADYWHEGGKS